MKAFPTIKGKMGDWNYYLVTMKMAEVANYIKFAYEVFPKSDLDQIMQRELTKRSEEIAYYLQNNDQRFLGSLIIAAVGGQPKFVPISFPEGSVFTLSDDRLGFLRFDGTETYYALDGQHRLAAIKEVLELNPTRYAQDEVSLTLVWHGGDEDGMKRARRLFTTVNRYAKKTNKSEDLVFDEDNPVDIYTRRLVRENVFFKEKIKIARLTRTGEFELGKSEALRPGDENDNKYLMALLTLRRCNEILLQNVFLKDRVKPQVLPSFEDLEEGYSLLTKRWEILLDHVPAWKNLRDHPGQGLDNLRTKLGGNVLVRPIAIIAFVTAVSDLLDRNGAPELITKVAERLKDITAMPWLGLLWKSEGGGMHDGQVRRGVAAHIFSYYLNESPTIEEIANAWESATGVKLTAQLPDRNSIIGQ